MLPQSIAHTMIVSSNLPPDAWDVILAESQGNFADCQSPVKKKLKSNSPVVVALPRATVAAAASLPPPPPLPDAYLHHGLSNRELGRIRGLKKNDLIAELDSMGGDYLKSWTKAHLVDALLEAYAAHNCPLAETQVATTKYDEFLGNNDVEMMQDVSVSETENKKKPNEAQPSSKGSSKHSAVSRPKHHHITKSNDGSFRKAQPLRQQGMVKRAIAAKEKQATAAKCVVARGATAAAQPKDIVDDGNDCMSITSLADETDKPDAPSAVVAVELAKAAKEKPVAKGVVARGAVAAAEPKRIIGDDKRMSSISLAATDKLEALSIVVDDDDDDATKPHVVENDRDSTAMEIDEPVAAQTSAAVDAPDDEYDESEDEEFFTAPQSGSQGSQLFSQKPVAVQKYVSKLTPIKGSAVKPPRSSPSAVPRGFVHSITKQLQASQTKQPPPQPVMFPSLHGRDGYGNEREPHLTDELEYAKKQMANNRLLLTPAFSGNLLSGAKPGGSEVLKAFSEARMKRAAEIKAAVRLMERSSTKSHVAAVPVCLLTIPISFNVHRARMRPVVPWGRPPCCPALQR